MANGIIALPGAESKVDITPNLKTAQVEISVFEAFDKEPKKGTVNLFEFLEIAARIQVEVCRAHIQAMQSAAVQQALKDGVRK